MAIVDLQTYKFSFFLNQKIFLTIYFWQFSNFVYVIVY